MSDAGANIPPPPVKPLRERLIDLVLWGGIAVVLIASIGPVNLRRLPMLFANSANLRDLLGAFLHPDLGDMPEYIAQMWLTVQMALWGTFIAIFIAIPLGLAAARNISPVWIQQPVRRILDVLRSLPELVMGLAFIVTVGLGPLTGVLALAINTGGVLGKLFSEAVETVAPGPIEGVRATGAAPLQEIVWGVIPQVAPLWTSYALYRFESNARAATVLGFIGAGGIGQMLFNSMNAFEFSQTAAMVIVIIVAVTLIDLLSQAMRSRLI
ncbi:MAG TPA: phosphonate ABC transporter, permease protein PhnE [Caulobacteraceae bacterium]|nr:phosphonate ABC transporter, permease protein PhnE [Caulobacteraceae bacterium]